MRRELFQLTGCLKKFDDTFCVYTKCHSSTHTREMFQSDLIKSSLY